MASTLNLDDEDDFGGDVPGSQSSTKHSDGKRKFGDLDEEEEDVFGRKVHVPPSCMIDGVHSQHFFGTGVIVHHSETMGLAVVDKNTVAVSASDVMLSFAAYPMEIPGEVVFLHPVHNYALVAYDPSALGVGASSVHAAELLPDATGAKTDTSKVTESAGSSPLKNVKPHAADDVAAVGKTFRRSEKPTEPPNLEQAFAPVGNVDFTAELKNEGKLGLFFSRDRARRDPIPITMIVDNYYNGIFITTRDSMTHLLQTKTEFNDTDLMERIDSIATQLAIGACLMTYLKLRALIFIELPTRFNSANLKRPKAIADLPVVAPFAFAIQQLGAVNIANLNREARYVPVLPDEGHTYGIPTGYSWNPNKYAQAVDYARKIGLHFTIVDVKQKSGTAWWLLRQRYAEEVFKLKLPFPEVNFTSAMALTHTMFLNGSESDPSNPIFDLTDCGTSDFGYILREPHSGINVSTFEVIDESAKEIV